MKKSLIQAAGLGLLAAAISGCNTSSSNYSGEITQTSTRNFVICHGYDCAWKTKVPVTGREAQRYAAIMAAGRGSAEAERRAVGRAVSYFEERNAAVLAHRDTPMSQFRNSGKKGEMDCIDEGTNTQTLLRYLEKRGLLRHHTAGPTVTRGFVLDGQFPHVTAVLQEKGGRKWSVDSWPTAVGTPPEIMPLDQWVTSGNLAAEIAAAL